MLNFSDDGEFWKQNRPIDCVRVLSSANFVKVASVLSYLDASCNMIHVTMLLPLLDTWNLLYDLGEAFELCLFQWLESYSILRYKLRKFKR